MALGLKTAKAAQDRARAEDLPNPLLERLLPHFRRRGGGWRWYTIEELREIQAAATLHRSAERIYWVNFKPDVQARLDNLLKLFRQKALPLQEDPDAVEYYENSAGKEKEPCAS